jgi:hypothetical protein
MVIIDAASGLFMAKRRGPSAAVHSGPRGNAQERARYGQHGAEGAPGREEIRQNRLSPFATPQVLTRDLAVSQIRIVQCEI